VVVVLLAGALSDKSFVVTRVIALLTMMDGVYCFAHNGWMDGLIGSCGF